MSTNCPKCKKELIGLNLKKSSPNESEQVLKSRLVFIDFEKSTVAGQCSRCGSVVDLPLKIERA